MKLVVPMLVSLSLVAGCGSKEASSGSAAPGAPPGTGTSASPYRAAGSPGGAPAAAGGDSFFAGDVPAAVKMKATKTFAMAPGVLMIQGIEGWAGGQLPGYDYMSMNKEGTLVARVATSPGVTGEMNCKELGTPAAMAPLRAKNLKDSGPVVLRRVGKNKFVAREGACTADGPKGPIEIRFIDILRKDNEGMWHYAALVGYPKDATPDMKNEAMAWARSLEYNGQNGFTMP
jgi:hypothetical protein